MIQEHKCDFCGDLFTADRVNKLNFCSRKCYENYRNRNKSHTCAYCGKVFERPQWIINKRKKEFQNHKLNFCSFECSKKWHVGEKHQRFSQVDVVCVICGKVFRDTNWRVSTGRTKTCSNECKYKYIGILSKNRERSLDEFVRGENHPNWQGGISFEPYCPKFNKEFKERVRAFFNYRCVECGKTQEEEGRALCCHHVNYNKKTCCDNTIPLFVPLCDTCHKRTNRHRDYWQLHFTELIYLQHGGKCYYSQEEFAQLTCTSEQAVAQEA